MFEIVLEFFYFNILYFAICVTKSKRIIWAFLVLFGVLREVLHLKEKQFKFHRDPTARDWEQSQPQHQAGVGKDLIGEKLWNCLGEWMNE